MVADVPERKQRAFVLRISPSYVDRVKEALEADELIIGWSEAAELLAPHLSREEFREVLRQTYYADDRELRRAGSATANTWRFIREMQINDLVVVPHWTGFYVARVNGPAYHDPAKIQEDTAFRRPVDWLNEKKPIPRTYARVGLQARMKAWQTCVDADDLLQEVREMLDTAAKGETPSFNADLRKRLIDETLREIRSGRINDWSFETLLKSLLESMGAIDVQIVPRFWTRALI